MLRRRGLYGLAAAVLALAIGAPPGTASAAPAEGDAVSVAPVVASDVVGEPVQTGYGALPGGLHVPDADDVPTGQLVVSGLAGLGYRKGLLAPDHRFYRALGDVGIAYAPIAHLAIALELDGRYDKHFGIPVSGDHGYVGDPRLLVRYTLTSGTIHAGVQGTLWVPGKSAPSVVGSAISVDGQLFATLGAGPGRLSAAVGYRLDHSSKSVTDVDLLSVQDQVSLGVSDHDEVFGGLHYVAPFAAGKGYASLEGSVEAFLGDGAPDPIYRGTLSAGFRVAPEIVLLAFVEAAKGPGIGLSQAESGLVPLAPYEPIVTGGIGLQAHFGGPRRATSTVVVNAHPQDVAVIAYADVRGEVTDDAGAPIVGAKVTVRLKNHTGTGTTDDKGAYSVAQLPIGKTVGGASTLDDTGAEVAVEVEGKKPGSATLTLAAGANAVPKIVLENVLPPGQLRGIVKSLASGKPIANATITIEPGGKTAQSGADGTFQIDLAPGEYKATVTAQGLAKQEIPIIIDPNGVAIKNIDLHK